MSEQRNTGGPAFPSHGSMGEVAHEGMTLRDYFAAKAMHALMTEPQWGGSRSMVSEWAKDSRTKPGSPERYAFTAYAMADALLKARES